MAWIRITDIASKGRTKTARSRRIFGDSIAIGVTPGGSNRPLDVVIRISKSLMTKSGFVTGDRVHVDFDDESNLCLISRAEFGGYTLSYAGTTSKKAKPEVTRGLADNATVRFRIIDELPVRQEKQSMVECEQISVEQEGIVFTLPSALIRIQPAAEKLSAIKARLKERR